MEHLKQALRDKAEAYQRRMQQDHARRLMEEVTDLTHWLETKAADVTTLAAAVRADTAAPGDQGEPER